jgi:hypothetical protein
MGVDPDIFDSCMVQMINCKCDQWFAENRQQRLGKDGGERPKPGSQTGSEHECFANTMRH